MARGSWFGTCLEALISSQINWIDIVVSFISTSLSSFGLVSVLIVGVFQEDFSDYVLAFLCLVMWFLLFSIWRVYVYFVGSWLSKGFVPLPALCNSHFI